MRYNEIVSETVYYKGEFVPLYATQPTSVLILKNPSKGELQRMIATAKPIPYSTGIELRGFLGDNDLYLWDSYFASHDAIRSEFKITGLHLYFYNGYCRMGDYLMSDEYRKEWAVETITQHPMMARIYGTPTPTDIPNIGFGFIPG